jgi:hypothetical protein
MLERKRLEAELLSLERQLRTFDRISDQLTAAGKEPSASYRQLQARREKVLTTLKQRRWGSLPSSHVEWQLPASRLDEPLLARSIAPAKFDFRLGLYGFGTSGVVQVAPASEGVNVVATGPFPHSGEIVTIPGSYPGVVEFRGVLSVGPDEISPSEYDPTINYFWLRNWKYLIPFPSPTVESLFTYRFDVSASVGVFFSGGEGNLMAFVSLGETPHLTTGTDVTVGIDAGWPLWVDLTEPGPGYNGHYGSVAGHVTVQRSFMVAGGAVPGVAVVVGVVAGLSMMSQVSLYFPGIEYSGIGISSQAGGGRVTYSYEPQPMVAMP